jgi:hypothetical protein
VSGKLTQPLLAQGSYEPIAEQLFQGLAVDRFLLEYDTERAGGFEPLRCVPSNKTVVLGPLQRKSHGSKSRRSSYAVLRRRRAMFPWND